MISDGIAIVNETNASLLVLKTEIGFIPGYSDDINTRMARLRNVYALFKNAVDGYHNALRKYKSDIESAFRGDVLA